MVEGRLNALGLRPLAFWKYEDIYVYYMHEVICPNYAPFWGPITVLPLIFTQSQKQP